MITTVQEFDESTAFERYVLEAVAPLAPLKAPPGPGGRHDLRTNTVGVALGVVMCGDTTRAEQLEATLKPLAFGAAWKVIDLLIEYALHASPRARGRMPIATKVQYASSGVCPPLSTDGDVWQRVAKLYEGTEQARHCLVHRRFNVGPAGELTSLLGAQGQAVSDVTAAEQQAFCRLAQRLADAVITGMLSPRARGDIAGLLNALAAHHGEPVLPAQEVLDVRVIVDDAERTVDGWALKVTELLNDLRARYRPGTLFDLELHFPDTAYSPLRCELDQAPPGSHVIDPGAPPSWLSLPT
jgi:hypothetical protein